MVNPKVLSSFLVIRIAMISYLNGNIFVSSTVIWAEKSFVTESLCNSGPNILLSTSFTGQQINPYTDLSMRFIYNLTRKKLKTLKNNKKI